MENYRVVVYPIETTEGIEWGAEFPDVDGCVGGGDTPEEATKDAYENLESFLETLREEYGRIPQASNPYDVEYSGRLTIRLSKSLHRKAAIAAEEEGVSLNTLFVEAISSHLEKGRTHTTVIEAKPVTLDFPGRKHEGYRRSGELKPSANHNTQQVWLKEL